MSRWFATFAAVVAALLTFSLARAEEAKPDPLSPQHVRCIWTEDPAHVALLSWDTIAAGESHAVTLTRIDAPVKDAKAQSQAVAAQRSGRYAAEGPELHYHHARVEGLAPGAEYEVVFESDGRRSRTFTFGTAPADDRPVSIVFGADSRSGKIERKKMNRLLARMAAESRASGRPPILALAHGGDYMVDGSVLAEWNEWLGDSELTASDDGRLLPIIPARGNHDHGELFNQVFGFPAEDRNFYALDVGPQLRWITLNTETSIGGEQAKWLAKELASSRPTHRWVVAQYHRPAFPAVKLPSRALVHWVPLFEKFNVDLVCEGDGHNIKRTPPLRDNKIDPTGVPYIGEGGLGVGQRTPDPSRWYLHQPEAKFGSDHHVQLLTFDSEKLSYRVVLMSGETFDEHAWPVRPEAQRRSETEARRTAAAAQ